MITKTKEPIEVFVIFHKDRMEPFSFKWGKTKYAVEKINLVFSKQSGGGRAVYYSLSSLGNYFKIVFYTQELRWYIEEMYEDNYSR